MHVLPSLLSYKNPFLIESKCLIIFSWYMIFMKKFLILLNKSVICLWCYFVVVIVVVIEVLTVTFTVCEKMSP